jgi:catechol 2,3-dioxygenase-like lactoylglutathione lyase family enzyme
MRAARWVLVAVTSAAAGAGAALVGSGRVRQREQPAPTVAPDAPTVTGIRSQFTPDHVALRVPDLEKAVAWYERVFGAKVLRRSKVPNIDPDIEIAMLAVNAGFHVELVGGGRPSRPAPPAESIKDDYAVQGYKHVCYRVGDMEAVLAHLREQKVDVFYQTTRPDYGVKIALLRDLNGYVIELYAPL